MPHSYVNVKFSVNSEELVVVRVLALGIVDECLLNRFCLVINERFIFSRILGNVFKLDDDRRRVGELLGIRINGNT